MHLLFLDKKSCTCISETLCFYLPQGRSYVSVSVHLYFFNLLHSGIVYSKCDVNGLDNKLYIVCTSSVIPASVDALLPFTKCT